VSDAAARLRVLAPGRVDAPALCFVHPASGDSTAYAGLAAQLDWPGPVLGIDAHGLHAAGPAPSSLAAIAADYLDCAGAPEGVPRFLLGWSVGGVIAAEMSQQLHDAGQPVAFLGLFDCRAPVPEMRQRPTDEATLARMFAVTTARVRGRELVQPPADASPAAVLRALREVGVSEWTEEEVARRLAVGARLARALFTHDQRRIAARIHLFEAEGQHPQHPRPATLGWELHGEVVSIPVPGTHFTLMSDENLPGLAAELGRYLGAAGSR
jgi:thioesterase domain-containing protein